MPSVLLRLSSVKVVKYFKVTQFIEGYCVETWSGGSRRVVGGLYTLHLKYMSNNM